MEALPQSYDWLTALISVAFCRSRRFSCSEFVDGVSAEDFDFFDKFAFDLFEAPPPRRNSP